MSNSVWVNFRSFGRSFRMRQKLNEWASNLKSYGNFVQTSAESSSLLECYAECSRNSSKKTKASRKTQRLCMGEYMMAPASPLRVGTRLKQGWCYCQCLVSPNTAFRYLNRLKNTDETAENRRLIIWCAAFHHKCEKQTLKSVLIYLFLRKQRKKQIILFFTYFYNKCITHW